MISYLAVEVLYSLSPANVAVMLALPKPTPVTVPFLSTVATSVLSDDQVIVLPDNVCSPAFKVGSSWRVWSFEIVYEGAAKERDVAVLLLASS